MIQEPVAEGWIDELTAHLERTSRLSRPEAERLVQEVVEFFSESLEDFVARRHRDLQARGLRNETIYVRISEEVARRRFAAPALSERQIRRLIYG